MSRSPVQHLKHFMAARLTGDRTVPFHWLVHEPWDAAFRAEYRRAREFDGAVNKAALRRVWVLSYSCSGTHNFYTHFHYMPGAFALGENTFIDKENDPFQFRFQPQQLRPAHWLYGSAFLQQGLQQKDGRRLTHIFLLSNHYLKYPQAVTVDPLGPADRIVFYQRNFIRVLFSQDRDSRKFNKPHFAMTAENFARSVASHRRRIDEMVSLVRANPDRVQFCFHEAFCAAPERVIHEICDGIGLAPADRAGWDKPEAFFTRCYRNGRPPERREDALWCPVTGKPIYGKGGEYNPLPPISLKRTISAPIRDWASGDRLSLLRQTFGDELVDFWLNDDTFEYAKASQRELSDLLERSVGKGVS